MVLHLSNRKKYKKVHLSRVKNFVRMKRRYMKQKIFHGSFHLRMAFNYMVDLVKRSNSYIYRPTRNQKKEHPEIFKKKSKVLIVKMPSRMTRGKKKPGSSIPRNSFFKKSKKKYFKESDNLEHYKNSNTVFLIYTPIENGIVPSVSETSQKRKRKCDYINGYICSCMNGRRIAGVCSHVATVIHFLSRGKNIEKKKRLYPGEHLNKLFKNFKEHINPR